MRLICSICCDHSKLKPILFVLSVLFLSSFSLNAQKVRFSGRVTQSESGAPVAHAIVDIIDSSRNAIHTLETDSSGIFTTLIDTSSHSLALAVSHAAGCDFYFLPYVKSLKKFNTADTLNIVLTIIYNDYKMPFLLAKKNTLLFSTAADSLRYCSLTTQDTSCPVYHELNLLSLICNCDPVVSKVEVLSWYTKKENKMHGDSLAIARANAVIAYMNSIGMPSSEFVITTRYLEKFPLRRPDGTYYKSQPAVGFRILAYKNS